jgi:hypothetical protein
MFSDLLSDIDYKKIEEFSNTHDTDVFIYCGGIEHEFDEKIISECSNKAKTKRKNI